MLKTMRKANIKGFSLVELMVVVAIIGILAAVAIPNFQRFQRRSRQAEGKNSLGSIHQAQTVFFNNYDLFYAGLREISVPVPVGTILYNAGFGAVNAAPSATLGTLYPKAAGIIASGESSFYQAGFCVQPCNTFPVAGAAGTTGRGGAIAAAASANNSLGTNAMFTAEARAFIGGAAEDIWQMPENKVLMQTSDGVL